MELQTSDLFFEGHHVTRINHDFHIFLEGFSNVVKCDELVTKQSLSFQGLKDQQIKTIWNWEYLGILIFLLTISLTVRWLNWKMESLSFLTEPVVSTTNIRGGLVALPSAQP